MLAQHNNNNVDPTVCADWDDNIAPNAKCQRVLVLALCLVVTVQLEEEETAGTVRLSKFLPLMTQVLLERRSVSITVFINHLYSGPGGAIS